MKMKYKIWKLFETDRNVSVLDLSLLIKTRHCNQLRFQVYLQGTKRTLKIKSFDMFFPSSFQRRLSLLHNSCPAVLQLGYSAASQGRGCRCRAGRSPVFLFTGGTIALSNSPLDSETAAFLTSDFLFPLLPAE